MSHTTKDHTRKTILFIAPQPFFEARGTPMCTKDTVEILTSVYDVDLLTYNIGTDIHINNTRHIRCFSFGYTSIKIGPSYKKIILDLSLFFSMLKLIFSHKYDYIHGVEEGAFLAILFSKIKKIPLIYDMDSIMSEQIAHSPYAYISHIFAYIENVLIKNSTLIFGMDSHLGAYCKKINPDCNFVEIFDCPNITQGSIPQNLHRMFISNKKKVLYIGNNASYQGIPLLEKTAEFLPDIDFYIIGCSKNTTYKNIKHISSITPEQGWGVMQLADVLISPRISGMNTPMKAYTYIASGKPIVATKITAHQIFEKFAYMADSTPQELEACIRKALACGARYTHTDVEIFLKKYNRETLKNIILSAYATI